MPNPEVYGAAQAFSNAPTLGESDFCVSTPFQDPAGMFLI